MVHFSKVTLNKQATRTIQDFASHFNLKIAQQSISNGLLAISLTMPCGILKTSHRKPDIP
jgi:hypothetical protein